MPSRLVENLARVRERMSRAADRAGRDAAQVTLLAVTKGQGLDVVRELRGLGLREFGENRAQEALPKMSAGIEGVRWHMLGHLQENKINKILPLVHMIQSVDSVELACGIDRRAARSERVLPVLLEVKTSAEPTKGGFTTDEVLEAAGRVATLPNLRLLGLMTMAPLAAPAAEVRRCFATLRRLGSQLGKLVEQPVLSMGMSDDFEIAIEEGSTMIRVGRALVAP